MKHTCHARRCIKAVSRRHLMCRAHWAMVPKALQRDVWKAYKFGQELSPAPPSKEYVAAARAAIVAVDEIEKKRARESVAQQELFT